MNAIEMICGKHQKARELYAAALPRLGWKQVGTRWRSPYSQLCYNTGGAILVEKARGTFARERMAAYNAKRPQRDRAAERRRRGRPPGIHTIPQRTAQFA